MAIFLIGFTDCAPPSSSAGTDAGASSPVSEKAPDPHALRRAVLEAEQSEARHDERYAVTSPSLGATALAGRHPTQQLALTFDASGASVRANAGWQLGLSATGVRCDGQALPLLGAAAEATDANRVSYRRRLQGSAFEEWYVNGPRGLEQGFTLSASPCPAGAKRLSVEVAVAGLRPQLASEGESSVRLLDDEGASRARYTDWFAYDAQEGALPLAVAVENQRILLEVELTGAAFPITIDPIVWAERQKLSGIGGFGHTVRISGNTALVGAFGEAAYVYVRSGSTWALQQKLTASDASGNQELFGNAVALDGDTAVVSAAQAPGRGKVYIYVRSGTTWTEQKKLGGTFGDESQGFGYWLALSGNTLLVGALDLIPTETGRVEVFVRSGTAWTQQQVLKPSDSMTEDSFGAAAIVGDTAVIGASGHANNRGAGYVFVRSGTVWSQQQKLTPSDPVDDLYFGISVALSGETALFGTQPIGNLPGAAYVYTRSETTWSQQQKLTASDGKANNFFGYSVALLGDTALLGTRTDAAYAFGRSGTVWQEQMKMLPSDLAPGGTDFGVALGDRVAMLGARQSNAVYVFESGADEGDSCAADGDCVSKHCVEKVCCDTACQGTCQSCLKARKASGADGACGAVKAGTDPLNQCTAAAASTCKLDGSCNGAGACRQHVAGTECAPASCPTNKSENLADSCNGTGTCVVTATAPCQKGYVCAAGACNTSCTAEVDCDTAAGYSCIAGQCQIAKGAPCKDGDICQTGHCTDGVCCDAVCDGKCNACLQALTGEPDGTCAPVPAGQDPQNECPADPGLPASCGADGACNGKDGCRAYAVAGTPCGAPTTCRDDQVSGEVCSGAGTCSNDTVDCDVYRCAGKACATACSVDEDCQSIAYCITGGTCVKKKEDGVTCSVGRECQSDQCVDGVCCESACEGQCASCAEAGSEGRCVAVAGEPRSGRAACDGNGDVCQGACDGVNQEACAFPGETRVCERACSGNERELLSHCSGAGSCEPGTPTNCGSYVCRGDRCLSECKEDADCQSGYGCSKQQCVAKSGRCNEDNTKSHTNDGADVPCAPYLCDPSSGACRTACSSSEECGSSFVCNSGSQQCVAATASPDDGGCGCRAVGRSPARHESVLTLALLGLAGAFRLRRSRRLRAAALLGALGLLGCTDADVSAGSGTLTKNPQARHTSASLSADAQAQQRLQRSYLRDRQTTARLDRRYAIAAPPSVGAAFSAKNPDHDLALSFGRSGAGVGVGKDLQVDLTASALRCGEQVLTLDAATATPGSEPNRVSYRRTGAGAGLDEWYENGPLGLEQGFTFTASPCASAESELGIEVAVNGLTPHLGVGQGTDGQRQPMVELLDTAGNARALYSDWLAYDATGRPLPLDVTAEGGRVVLFANVSAAAFPVTIDPLIWTQKKRLGASDRVVGTQGFFGSALALDGTTALIGANAWNSYQGAAYVNVRSGTTWTEQQKLLPTGGAPNDWFGYTAALSGNTALVGAYNGNAAYVFVRSGTTWTEQKKLTEPGGGPGNRFGYAVALAGNTALVSAPSSDGAYVFVRSGTTWTQQQKLVPSDGAAAAGFGQAVALEGDTALVTATGAASSAGAAYVFVRSGTTWTEQQKLTGTGLAANDQFGMGVALSGNTAVIGAPFHAMTGTAYVFVRSGTTWTEQKQLTPGDAATNDAHGWAVAISGETAIVGSRGDEGNTGAVYVYGRTGTTWTEQKKLTASDKAPLDNLGVTLAYSGGDVLAGAQFKDGSAGAVYVFGLALEDTDTCAKDEDCASQHCVENVCCNTACSGTCQTCLAARKASGANGVCGNVKVATDPRNACATADVSTCGFEGTCNGTGACTYYSSGTECAAAVCPSATSENPADSCNGTGACVVKPTVACKPGYACVSGACKTSCSGDGDCDTASGHRCNAGKCQIPQGGACRATDVCATGQCVDGVCCDTACTGNCVACVNDATGVPDGTCAPALPGSNPRNKCVPDVGFPESCRADGACDGAGACRVNATDTTPCGATDCAKGTVSGKICDGSGKCGDSTAACGNYTCDDAGVACRASCANDTDCAAASYCVGGVCAPKKAGSAQCTEANECLSEACADGVCCDRACSGQCEACAEKGQVGTCVTVDGEPRGERAACASDDEACAGTCDGVNELACAYPSAKTECGRACSASRESVNTCNGEGACVEATAANCEKFACGTDRCLTECEDDTQCQMGFACKAKACVVKGLKCVDDRAQSQDLTDDTLTSCAPYLCEESAGACLTTCRSSTDCVSGYVCNAQSRLCEEVVATTPTDESDCGCRAAGGRPAPWSLQALLVLMGALALRRKHS